MAADVQDLSLYKHIDCLASEACSGVQREDVSDNTFSVHALMVGSCS